MPTTGLDGLSRLRFSQPTSIAYLEIDNLSCEGELWIFENLTTLVWNNSYITSKMRELVHELVQGRLQRLTELHMNLIRFDSTMQSANRALRENAQHFYVKLMNWRSEMDECNLKIWINGLQLDLNSPRLLELSNEVHEVWEYAQWVAFERYHLANPLIDCHLINFSLNQTPLHPLRTVLKTDYLILEQRISDLLSSPRQPATSDPNQLPSPEFNLAFFHRQFPNIQVLKLDRRELPISYDFDAFVRFVGQCRALTQLELYHSELPAHLYPKLFATESVRTLWKLVLNEPPGHPQIDFAILANLPYLQNLDTNLATRIVMLRSIARMAFGPRFTFRFRHPTVEANEISVEIRRHASDLWQADFDAYPAIASLFLNETTSLSEIETFFKSPSSVQNFRHWLD